MIKILKLHLKNLDKQFLSENKQKNVPKDIIFTLINNR